jgi:hypothetical protein
MCLKQHYDGDDSRCTHYCRHIVLVVVSISLVGIGDLGPERCCRSEHVLDNKSK